MGISVDSIDSFQVELEFENVCFCGGRKPIKTGVPGENPSERGRELTTNSTHIWRETAGQSNPGRNWWEASALTTPPSLLPFLLILHASPNFYIVTRPFQ